MSAAAAVRDGGLRAAYNRTAGAFVSTTPKEQKEDDCPVIDTAAPAAVSLWAAFDDDTGFCLVIRI